METILILFFIGLIVLLSIFKTKLSDKRQLIVASIAGFILLTWLWGFENGERHWKILITVVVIYSVYNLARKIRSSEHKNDSPLAS